MKNKEEERRSFWKKIDEFENFMYFLFFIIQNSFFLFFNGIWKEYSVCFWMELDGSIEKGHPRLKNKF